VMLLDWGVLKHFKKYNTSDVWGDPSKLDAELLMKLDDLREFIGMPIHILSGYREGDPREHGKGTAADFVCPGVSLMDLYLACERFAFRGLGVYPHWSYDGIVTGGCHADTRDLGTRIGTHHTNYKGSRWLAYKDKDGVQKYTTLDLANLRRYGVV